MKEVLGVQYLRGLAAYAVVVFHVLPLLAPSSAPETFWQAAGSAGVDVFFVISGFIIWTSTVRGTPSPVNWWASRLIRIVPLYWLALVATLLLLSVPAGADPHDLPEPLEMLKSFLFVFTRNSRTDSPTPFFTPGWTLNYEFFFYAVVGLSLLIRQRALRLAAVIAVFVTLIAMRRVVDTDNAMQFRYTSPLQLEFIAGMLIAVITPHLRRWSLAPLIGAGALVAFVVFGALVSPTLFPNGPRSVYFGVPAALLVFAVVMLEDSLSKLPLPPLKALGDASYSLYLVHTLVLAQPMLWQPMVAFGQSHHLAGFLLYSTMAVVAGLLTYRYLEKPMLAAMRSRLLDPVHGPRRNRLLVACVANACILLGVSEMLASSNGVAGAAVEYGSATHAGPAHAR